MTRKHADLEQEFLADLPTRTGRDLAAWMTAIAAARLTDKNAIIDWLRPQGLTFAHASWLERIHNNGGRPIYLDEHTPQSPRPAPAPPPAARAASPAARLASTATSDPEQIKQLLARGKAFRPLAEYLVAEIRRAVPEIAVTTADEVLVFASPRPFAVLWISPRDLRLGLDLGDRPFDADLVKAKLPGTGIAPGLTHMLVLNDARQIGPALLALVGHAAARVNRSPPGA